MSMTGRITLVTRTGEPPQAHCRCGANADVIEMQDLGSVEFWYTAGALNEPCRCPRCFSCQRLLDDSNRCENLDCLNLGIEVVAPDHGAG